MLLLFVAAMSAGGCEKLSILNIFATKSSFYDLCVNKKLDYPEVQTLMAMAQKVVAKPSREKESCREADERLKNLEEFNISSGNGSWGTASGNLRPLEVLKHLKKLEITAASMTEIDDLSPLSTFQNLTELKISFLPNIGLSPIARLKSLEILSLPVGQVSDVSGLYLLRGLVKLELYSQKLIDLSPLRDMSKLSYLDVSRNQISSVTALSGLKKLRVLSLQQNKIRDITALESLSELEQLDLSDNEITNVEPLSKLVGLKKLSLSGNKLTQLDSLKSLSKLELLCVVGQSFEKMKCPLSSQKCVFKIPDRICSPLHDGPENPEHWKCACTQ